MKRTLTFRYVSVCRYLCVYLCARNTALTHIHEFVINSVFIWQSSSIFSSEFRRVFQLHHEPDFTYAYRQNARAWIIGDKFSQLCDQYIFFFDICSEVNVLAHIGRHIFISIYTLYMVMIRTSFTRCGACYMIYLA